MTPTQNHYVQFLVTTHPEFLGSTRSYTLLEADARKYLNISGNGESVLALQALIQLHSGSPPFNEMAMLGGDRINRGYYEGRYRDQNAVQIQAEWRQGLFGRFGFTVFGATGEVWNCFENFTLQNYKWSGGAGIRINANREDPLNLRIDFGVTGESTVSIFVSARHSSRCESGY